MSGQYILEMVANYENLVVAEGKTLSTIDDLTEDIMQIKEKYLNETLKETDFKDGLRTKYKIEEARQAEERKGLTDITGYVNFEVDRFAISNQLIYFREIENLEEVRKALEEA